MWKIIMEYDKILQTKQEYLSGKPGGIIMTYQEAYQKLEQAGQAHVLQYYDSLTEGERQELLQQVAETDFSVTAAFRQAVEPVKKGLITPLGAMQIPEIEAGRERFEQSGLEALKAGRVGAVLLAGGMGTRLGADGPKGIYDIGQTRPLYIFECLIHNLLEVVKQAETWVHLFIMTSDKNHDAAVSFLREHNYFGYKEDYIAFFKQEMVPATDYNGKALMESRSRIAASPNGNGGWYASMKSAGVLDIVKREGIEWLNVFAVDNVLQRIADPCFVGAVLTKGCACGAKVVKKNAPDEKVGVMCLEDGRPGIVEYYELTEDMMNTKDESGEPAYNFGVILNYLFRESDLAGMLGRDMPLHVVEKKIPYMDEAGNLIEPETPNGYKYETLALDMVHRTESCVPFEVIREREFAPIKNKDGVDSVETARELLKRNGITL